MPEPLFEEEIKHQLKRRLAIMHPQNESRQPIIGLFPRDRLSMNPPSSKERKPIQKHNL
jgi:hypothetical protein